jgi:hypothetical protein
MRKTFDQHRGFRPDRVAAFDHEGARVVDFGIEIDKLIRGENYGMVIDDGLCDSDQRGENVDDVLGVAHVAFPPPIADPVEMRRWRSRGESLRPSREIRQATAQRVFPCIIPAIVNMEIPADHCARKNASSACVQRGSFPLAIFWALFIAFALSPSAAAKWGIHSAAVWRDSTSDGERETLQKPTQQAARA